ncbi:MAG: hypothetical protein JW969_17275 [Spirochaetales bacterium]|nr:hypothetical protein [Spirochaetales bacterium]
MRIMIRIICILLIVLPPLYCEDNENTDSGEWKAVVCYFPGPPEDVSEDWSWLLYDIETVFEGDTDFQLIYIYEGDPLIAVVGDTENPLARLDITKYAKDTAGYLFAMKGKAPEWEPYNMSGIVMDALSKYFFDDDDD